MYYRIDRRGDIIAISDDPSTHTHTYYGSVLDAVIARRDEFQAQIKTPFTMLLEYDSYHDRFNVMTANPAVSMRKNYKPLNKKRSSVFVRGVNTDFGDMLEQAGIAYVIP